MSEYEDSYEDDDEDEGGRQIGALYPGDLDDLEKKLSDWDRALARHWSTWSDEARFWYGMVAGEQWTREEKDDLAAQLRIPIVFNRIGPQVDAVAGAEITNRQQVSYFPREIGDAAKSEVLTAAAEWNDQQCDAADEESDAFFDVLVCGLGWTESRMDYEEDEEGMSRVDRVDPLEVKADPRATKKNLVDMRYVRRERVYSRDEFEERFPDFEFTASGKGDASNRTRHSDARDAYEGDTRGALDVNDPMLEEGECLVREYQWYELETYVIAVDDMAGETVEFDRERWETLVEQLARWGAEPPDHVVRQRRKYWRAYKEGNRLLEVEPLPDNEFTLKCITGKRDRNTNTWYGLVKAMCDPQRWSNKFFERILYIISTNANGGLIAEKDLTENPDEFEETWARPDAINWVKPGALAAGKIQNKPAAPYPQGLDRLMQVAVAGVQEASGVNKEMLGMADRQQAGVLEFQRKQAAYGMLAAFFDSLRRYRRLRGRLLLKHITKYMSDGRLIRVVGEDGAKYVPLIRQDGVAKHDVIVDDAPAGPNQKDRVWQIVQSMLPVLGEAGPDIWADLIMYTPLPTSLASKLAEKLRARMAPEQADPQQAALQQAGAQIQIRGAAAKAMRDEAAAAKTGAEAQAVQMENQLNAATAQALGIA